MKNIKVASGGLFRCCLDTIGKMSEDEGKLEALNAGDKITCIHCKKETMILGDDAVIRWVGTGEKK